METLKWRRRDALTQSGHYLKLPSSVHIEEGFVSLIVYEG